ncbi:hypothetical protein GTH52_07110 [Clostridium tyrobutyricum]|uniref:Uncharacterized protein n=1 Tax=Clostridium tyrobutyricum DIVETGP TaxID=1408889 RepID=W6NHB8_CLOTY|nr:hypothetical protein [Clostridium tyrobutyricum]AND84263.1 hypothetical protein CTK_C10020 [Clostridium tyrobutyricum]AND84347.1 hypothetical protein CTK_C10860 [Clostridium tyrobutyricum]ANP68979.1 hypothetical protein BA182_04610 [Clostridium tyrobutyricum]MBV4417309.1 hypothetical protein [Clostridium tyrobutyricum]MBV4426511.1 hypothetical protein [Clostridium tyrobutyricum]
MKDYLIWLKSGESISGTAKKDILEMLKDRFKDHKEEREIISFPDEEGGVILDMDRVEAIAINKCIENNKAGFK